MFLSCLLCLLVNTITFPYNFPLLIVTNSLSQIGLTRPENIVTIVLAITLKVDGTVIVSPIHYDIRILGTVLEENVPLFRTIFCDLGCYALQS